MLHRDLGLGYPGFLGFSKYWSRFFASRKIFLYAKMDSFYYFTFYEVKIKIENKIMNTNKIENTNSVIDNFARAIGMFSLLEKNLGLGFFVGWCKH